jgi:hypothetical protein
MDRMWWVVVVSYFKVLSQICVDLNVFFRNFCSMRAESSGQLVAPEA